MFAFALITLAWACDAWLGYPRPLYHRIGHPVTWMGRLISLLDDRWNRPDDSASEQRRMGVAAVLVVLLASVAVAMGISTALPDSLPGLVVEALLASALLASRSLFTHVADIWRPLANAELEAARAALSNIVGRDTAALDEPAIARASLESLAENTSDGVIAPVLWGVIFGLPGLVAYKAVNTLDSMIGHHTARHEHFGRFAARLDDVVNWLPARLSGYLFCIASVRLSALGVLRRDARQHRSPNAGWPESALAGGLGIRLSGPRRYGESTSDEPWLNGTARDPLAADVYRGLQLYCRTLLLGWSVLFVLALTGA